MDIALLLLKNLLPLYVIIALGFFGGRYLRFERDTLANLAIFICVPIVVFGYVAQLEFKAAYALLPVLVFIIATIVALSFYKLGQHIFKDNRANLMAMCASMGNTGYFGLPIIFLLFEPKWVAVYMFILLGYLIFEATIGYYLAVRGNFSVRESVIKVLRYPSIYAIAAGLVANAMHVKLPELYLTYWGYFKGAYVILGMMIIGVALSRINKLVFGARFLTLTFAGKFLVLPLLMAGLVALDSAYFHLFGPEVHLLLVIVSIVPPAANIAAFAAQLDLKPEKAATTVLMGTIFALFYIPAIFMIFQLKPDF